MNLIDLDLAEITDPRERGVTVGRSFMPSIRAACDAYDGLFDYLRIPAAMRERVVAATAAALAEHAPSALAEQEGIATGAALPLERILLLGARTEVLAAATPEPECSTAVITEPGPVPRSVQTWDWHARLVPDGLLLRLATGSGMRVRTFTEMGMLAKIGVNSAGLGLHFNILHHESDAPGAVGVPVHTIARMLLEEASTVEEAITLVRRLPVAASSVFTVLDRGGAAASIEVAPAGVGVVRPVDGVLLHTNHFLDPALAAGGALVPASTTVERIEHLAVARDAMRQAAVADLPEAMIAGDTGSPVCMREREDVPEIERWSTLLTCSIDVEASCLYARAGEPGPGPVVKSCA